MSYVISAKDRGVSGSGETLVPKSAEDLAHAGILCWWGPEGVANQAEIGDSKLVLPIVYREAYYPFRPEGDSYLCNLRNRAVWNQ